MSDTILSENKELNSFFANSVQEVTPPKLLPQILVAVALGIVAVIAVIFLAIIPLSHIISDAFMGAVSDPIVMPISSSLGLGDAESILLPYDGADSL